MASSLSITTLIADEIFGVYEQFYRDARVWRQSAGDPGSTFSG